jgi:octaprenyl-diphosphate synthase
MPSAPQSAVLGLLAGSAARVGVADLAERLAVVEGWLADELAQVEEALAGVLGGGRALERGAHHLLDRAGKRWRPLCLLLASRCAEVKRPQDARSLAVAVELIHTATLLHDDVIDEGTERRGVVTARLRFGNAVSVLAGDWLLVEALARVQAVRGGELLPALLDVLRQMAAAESLQLAHRQGRGPDVETYLRIVDGKTAGLFAWALEAGAVVCDAAPPVVAAMRDYGQALGRAFQLVDDVLDIDGDTAVTGKDTGRDLREGQANHVLVLVEPRDPALVARIRADATGDEWRPALATTGAVEETYAEAARYAARASALLEAVPSGPVRAALAALAQGAVTRKA